MELKIPEEIKLIIDKFSGAGYQIYIVGGAVRDMLLNKEVKDWDFTTDAKPEEILNLFPEGFYDNKFGTVGIASEKDAGEILEITTMRKEGEYQDLRHPNEVFWTDKVEEDLARRDFTINAMALSINAHENFRIIDPYGGQKDLEQKIIRAVGNPDKRFCEDALRLIRAVRIASELEFEIEEKTFHAIQKNSALITNISYERARDEFIKILVSSNPYIGTVKLREVGVLQLILPELELCFNVVQEGPKHDRTYDVGEHSLLSLKHCPSPDPITRFACLIHDIGKPATKAVQEDGNVTFYGHDVVGARIAAKIAERFRLSNAQSEKLIKLVRWHLFPVNEEQTDSAIRRFIKNIGKENIEEMISLRIGDRLGGGTQKAVSWRMEKFKERIAQVLKKPFSISDLKINGHDVMGTLNIPPSRKVGQILEKLFQEVLEDASKNNRGHLLDRIKNLE